MYLIIPEKYELSKAPMEKDYLNDLDPSLSFLQKQEVGKTDFRALKGVKAKNSNFWSEDEDFVQGKNRFIL